MDNFKIYRGDKDVADFQRMMHAMLEGGEKLRMKKESNELRDSLDYQHIPVVTGENYPGNDAATRARAITIDWTKPKDLDLVTAAKNHIKDLNAVGKEWCIWIGSEEGRRAMENASSRFEVARTYYLKKLEGAVNAGRLATNAAIISLVWDILAAWPVTADLAKEYADSIKAAIDEHIIKAHEDVLESLDGAKFISWLKAEIAVGRYSITGGAPVKMQYNRNTEVISHFKEDTLLILGEVLDAKLIPAWQKVVLGVKSDKKALLRQLEQLGYVIPNKKDKQHPYQYQRAVEGAKRWYHVLPWSRFWGDDTGDDSGDAPVTSNRDAEANVTGSPASPAKNNKVISADNLPDKDELEKQTAKTIGDTGDMTTTNYYNTTTDTDIGVTGNVTEHVTGTSPVESRIGDAPSTPFTCQRCGQPTGQLIDLPGGAFCATCAAKFRTEDAGRDKTPKSSKPGVRTYSEMADKITVDTSSPEAEKVSRAVKLMLKQGDAPRITSAYGMNLTKLTGLDETTIQRVLESWPWMKKEMTASGTEVWMMKL